MEKSTSFAAKVTLVQAVTYIVAGIIAYPLFTRQFFEGPSPLLAPLARLPSEPELWGHVMRWMLPAQILRGVLIAGALDPFLSTLQSWSFMKRFLSIASLYVVIGQWTSPVAGASTIEGWVILRPEFTTPYIVLNVIPEGLIQGLGLGAWLARWLAPKSMNAYRFQLSRWVAAMNAGSRLGISAEEFSLDWERIGPSIRPSARHAARDKEHWAFSGGPEASARSEAQREEQQILIG